MNKKEFFLMSIGIFLTVVAWLVIEIYHINSGKNQKTDIKQAVVPNYEINKQVIDRLLKREIYVQ